MGWDVHLPAVTRKTDRGLPTYDDEAESDVFVLSGAEDLVAMTGADGRPEQLPRVMDGRQYAVIRYRPRVEGLYARIERWRDVISGAVHWRSISRDNVTTVYGWDSESRIADPLDEHRVFSWLICQSWDDRGNAMQYGYAKEDSRGVDRAAAHERHRTDVARRANRYVKSVKYGNRVSRLVEPDLAANAWHFELVFDYGEHDAQDPTASGDGQWLCRNDPFSTYRAGFEIRNYRLCQRVLMFHHFPSEQSPSEPVGTDCLVRSMTLTYRGATQEESRRGEPAGAFLASVQLSGHRRSPGGGGYVSAAMPPLELSYSTAQVGTEVHGLTSPSIENLPVGLDGPGYQWIDLDSESIAGVLSEQAGAWFYAPNRGDGHLGPTRVLPTQPAGASNTQLLDLAGDGSLDYVSFAGPTPGYFARVDGPDGERGWAPHRPLRSLPAVDWSDPNLRFIDLSGDGRADLLITNEADLLWYPSLGGDGFDAGIRIPAPADERAGPRLVAGDRAHAIFTADMSGDGLSDLVRVRNGSVAYWPNLGHGRFGAQVVMDIPGPFDQPDRFDPRRIRLADVDGSGPCDLIYVGADGVDLYPNQLGNRLAGPARVPAFPAVDDLSSVSVVDLLGRGTACLVWSSMLPGDAGRHIRFVDLMGAKPNLLTRVRNNLGAETLLQYASSTEFYLADQAAGTPWVTRLPFPVHVVTGVESYDWISRNRLTSSYTYHHGYFDAHEREFRGFGLVEQHDTELMAAPARSATFPVGANESAATCLPTVLTRTWFHTGAHLNRDRISTLFADGYYPPPEHATAEATRLLLPDTVLPAGLTTTEEREACRALKGQVLRQEVYALDNTERAPHPYTVLERNYTVVKQATGVFAVHPRETVTVNHERNPSDPRVTHELVLEVDDFGTVLRSAALAYRRATPDLTLPERTRTLQAKTLVTETRTRVTELVDAAGDYRVPVAYDTQAFEITQPALATASALVGWEELLTALAPPAATRLVNRSRTRFERDDLTAPRPLGEQGPQALVHEAYQLILTPELVGAAFGARVDSAMLTAAGYVQEDGAWSAPSGTVGYAPAGVADVPGYARAHFFIPRSFIDPFGGVTAAVLDGYDLQPVTLTDPVGNTVTAEPNYRVLAPNSVIDPNGNRVAARYDALGLVVATAVLGSPADDTLNRVDLVDPEQPVGVFWGDPLGQAQQFLGAATTRIVHDLDAYLRTRDDVDPKPPASATIARERHVRDDPASPVQVAISYSDGTGREIQQKAQAEPSGRWVCSGWTVFNNKNLPVQQYEPSFTDTHRFQFGVQTGVSTTLCYDPVGRVVATLHPDQTWDKVVIGAWHQEMWDGNDTALVPDPTQDGDVGALLGRLPARDHTPTWYQQRITGGVGPDERAAAERTEPHAGTPTRSVLDPLGRPVLTVARNRTPGSTSPVETEHRTHVLLDIQGNQLEVRDCIDGTPGVTTEVADRLVARHTYDLAGSRIVEESMEAGTHRGFTDVLGMPYASWDHTDRRTTTTYDAARRPVEVILGEGTGEKAVARTVYGETATDASANLRGRAWQVRDAAGLLIHAYDRAGNLKRTERRVTVEYREVIDWSTDPALDPATWTAQTQFDALNRPTEVTHPNGTVVRPGYGKGGRLKQVLARLAGDAADTTFVQDITYDAKGQRLAVAHGNGVTTRSGYDARTFRLRTLDTLRGLGFPGDDPVPPDTRRGVQQLRYTYDPVGNITQIRDEAQPRVFNLNTLIEASGDYRYDALYRLVEASGREHRGDGMPTSWDDAPRTNPTDPNDLRRYTEHYTYDVAGNMTKLVHAPSTGTGWTRTFTCAEPSQLEPNRFSNRLTSTRIGSGNPEAYTYDDHGNMLRLAPMEMLRWNHLNQLAASSRQRVNTGVGEITYYVYDGTGQRIRKVTDRAAASLAAATHRTERLYLGDFEIYRTFDAGGSVTHTRTTVHIHDSAGRVAMIDDDVHERLIRYQYSNHLSSAIVELDARAATISYEEFYPYGSTALQIAQDGAPPRRYRYTGKERDEESGFSYHDARYYVAWLCRWSTADPAGYVDGFNLYRYCDCRPVSLTDRAGLTKEYAVEVLTETGVAVAEAEGMTLAELAAANDIGISIATEEGMTLAELAAANDIGISIATEEVAGELSAEVATELSSEMVTELVHMKETVLELLTDAEVLTSLATKVIGVAAIVLYSPPALTPTKLSVPEATLAYTRRLSSTPELDRLWRTAAADNPDTPGGFARARAKFWDSVNNEDSSDAIFARDMMELAGFELNVGGSNAPMLRVEGVKVVDQRLTIDHIDPKSIYPHLTLDPSNLVFMIQRDNSHKGVKLMPNSANQF